MTPTSYRISGQFVRSTIALPGCTAADPSATPDVTIGEGAVPATLAACLDRGPNWQVARDAILLDVPMVARFLVEGGNRITVALAPGGDPGALGALLAGSVIGLAFQQQGRVLVRASAVAVNGRAVLFCGDSGAGKSVLAAALNRFGYATVADDQCLVTVDSAGASVAADCAGVRLWPDVVTAFGLKDQPSERLREGLSKCFVQLPQIASPLPVAALYLLVASISGAPAITPRPLYRAAAQAWASAFRPALVRELGHAPAYFAASQAILRAGGIFTLSRIVGLPDLKETIAALEHHWASLGLKEPAR